MKRLLFLAVLAVSLAAISSAAIIPTHVGVAPSALNPGAFTHFYEVTLAGASELCVGAGGPPGACHTDAHDELVVIYDFHGFVPGSMGAGIPGAWDFSTAATGPVEGTLTGPAVLFPPDTAVTNLVYRWRGGNLAPSDPPGVPFDTIFADSIFPLVTAGSYEGQGTKVSVSALEDGKAQGSEGPVDVPAIPEPTSMALLGSGLLGFAFLARRRKK
jgi:hypothetical protein